MVKKTIILLVLYFFAVLPYKFAGKRIFCQEAGAGCLWPLGAGAAPKKIPGAGAEWEKNQEPEPGPEPLEKKSGAGAGAAKKFAGSPALIEIVKKLFLWQNFYVFQYC